MFFEQNFIIENPSALQVFSGMVHNLKLKNKTTQNFIFETAGLMHGKLSFI